SATSRSFEHSMIHRFGFPTTIHFGPGARKLVAEHLRSQRIARPLVVTDRGLAALPVFRGFLGELPGLAVEAFTGVAGNPVRSQVMDGAKAFREHRADAVIGIGGGAAGGAAQGNAPLAPYPRATPTYTPGPPPT